MNIQKELDERLRIYDLTKDFFPLNMDSILKGTISLTPINLNEHYKIFINFNDDDNDLINNIINECRDYDKNTTNYHLRNNCDHNSIMINMNIEKLFLKLNQNNYTALNDNNEHKELFIKNMTDYLNYKNGNYVG